MYCTLPNIGRYKPQLIRSYINIGENACQLPHTANLQKNLTLPCYFLWLGATRYCCYLHRHSYDVFILIGYYSK